MREIKFRGKCLRTNDWVYGSLIIKRNEYYIGYISDISGIWSVIQVEPKTVGQYTGLKDKNGKEIYEGDLIRKKFEDREIGEFYAVGQVVFGTWYAGFTVPYKYNGYNNLERLSSSMDKDGWVVANRDMEVIGNIYENHELLDT